MWLNRFTNYLLANRWQTIALTFIGTFIPVIGIVGILIAALVTLCKGVVEGAVLTVAATLPYILSFYFTSSSEPTFPLVVWAAVGVAVTSNLLTFAFAVMLRKQSSWSFILQIAALLGVLTVSVIHLIYPNVANWWGNQLQSYLAQAQAMAGALKNPSSMTNDAQIDTINVTKYYATGLMMAAILVNAVLQLIVARWWQAVVLMPGILRKELHNIRLSHLAGILFVASLILSYFGNAVVLDIMPIIYILFFAAGLSLIHYFFGQMSSGTVWFWLAVVYITLIFSLPMSLVLVAIFALLDVWLDLRKRLKKV